MAESASSKCQIHWIPSWPRIPCLNKETLLVITVDAEVQGGNMLVTGLRDQSKWLMQTWMQRKSFFSIGHLLLKIWRPHLHKSLKYTFQRQSLQMSLRVVRSCMKCFPQQNLPRSICCQTSSLDSTTGMPPNEHLVENGARLIRKSGNLHIKADFNKQLQLQAPLSL